MDDNLPKQGDMEPVPSTQTELAHTELAALLWAVPAGDFPAAQAQTWAADIALSAALQGATGPTLPFSLSAGLARRIAADAGEAQAEREDPVAALLRAQPRPTPPRSQAAVLAQAIHQEASHASLLPQAIQPNAVPHGGPQGVVGQRLGTALEPAGGMSVFAGLSVLLATGGLLALGRLADTGHLADTATGLAVRGLLAPLPSDIAGPAVTGGTAAPAALAALSSSSNLLGLALLIVGSALLLWRPSLRLRRTATLLLAVSAVLTLPAIWQSLHAARGLAGWGPLVVAGLLLQMALLRLGGQAGALVQRQAHFPLQTLAAGTLAELGLLGLGALLLTLGGPSSWLAWAAPLLGAATLLAALVGLGVSLLSLGRTLRQYLWPQSPRWLAGLASLGIYGVSLGLPPLAAVLLLVGGAWGLGSVVTAGWGLLRGQQVGSREDDARRYTVRQ